MRNRYITEECNKILNFWKLEEYFTPSDYPELTLTIKEGKQDIPFDAYYNAYSTRSLPLKEYKAHNEYLRQKHKSDEKLYNRANVYCGCYKIKTFVEKMAEKCKLDMEKYAEINELSGRFYIFSVQIDLDGKLTEEGVQISPFFYAVLCMIKSEGIAPNTMTKLRRDEEVSLTILSKICKTLHADFGDIVEYVPDAEIWDLYNENRELLGKDHVRGEQLPIDRYHLVVHVWIRNSKGEYLISQRSANRPTYPLMWECVGGSVVKGEDSLLGAIREAKEEVGVDLMPENGQVLFTKTRKIIEGKIFNDIMDVWLFEYDGEVDLGNATTDEVAQVAWMNREQIKELFEQEVFVGTLEYFFTEVDKERR